jgi:hypothetical protein
MANWPTYDPAQYYKESDASVFSNAAVSSPLEVGSIMKTLTAAAALDQGVIKPDTSHITTLVAGRWMATRLPILKKTAGQGPIILAIFLIYR